MSTTRGNPLTPQSAQVRNRPRTLPAFATAGHRRTPRRDPVFGDGVPIKLRHPNERAPIDDRSRGYIT